MAIKTGGRTIYVPKGSSSALHRLLDTRGDENISHTLETAVDRYLTVIGHSMPAFSDSEWCLVLDALLSSWISDEVSVLVIHETVAEAIDADGLDVKWGVDGHAFKERLSCLTYAERQAIAEIMELFRMVRSRESYSAIIPKLIDQFSQQPSDLSDLKDPGPTRLRPEYLEA